MRPHSLTLCLICKNEIENFPKLLDSVVGCFEEIHITDTGSTDGTLEYIRELEAKGFYGTKVSVKQFPWVNDFAKARNYSIKDVTTDFWMWMDLDDTLEHPDLFLLWKQTAMSLADYWLATYNYAYSDDKPVVSFARERVIRTKLNLEWEFFVHEGVSPGEAKHIQYATSWAIKHNRTLADMEKDKGRNLKLFSFHDEKTLHPRMKFYLGKEYYENGDPMNAWRVLAEVVSREDLQIGDRLLALQYLGQASTQIGNEKAMAEAVKYAHLGLQLDPNRAEFWCIIGDVYVNMGKLYEARMAYIAAMRTHNQNPTNSKVQGFIHSYDPCHNVYPHKQFCKVLFNLCEWKECALELEDALKIYPDAEFEAMYIQVKEALRQIGRDKSVIQKTSDIVFTTHPIQAYEWDDVVYKTKGVGGSETAVIEMANWLRKLTNRRVIVFNMREKSYTNDLGVEYKPNNELNEYFSQFEPAIHIASRHNNKITDARTYLWCHDLLTPGVERGLNADYIFCLSQFHADYVKSMQGVSSDRIRITRNGLVTERFKDIELIKKNENKIVFPSSPDRGLDRAINVVEKAREKHPDLELHVYYGIEHLHKYGLESLGAKLKEMMAARPWVKYHGNLKQDELAKELMEAVIWLYPASFIETFCITAIECLAARCFPIARSIGALQDTLKKADRDNAALLIDRDAEEPHDIQVWADFIGTVLKYRLWESMAVDVESFAWESVAREWLWLFGLEAEPVKAEWKNELVQESVRIETKAVEERVTQ